MREEKGFTLVELLVVMSILAVLAAVVFPTVTGLKTTGETAAGKADAKEVENAINAFNTNSRAQEYPESNISFNTSTGYSINDKNVAVSNLPTSTIGLVVPTSNTTAITSHRQINWYATADVRQSDGTLKTLKFIPDFLLSKPKSATWVRGSSSSAADEFLWLLLKGTASDGLAGRTLQVLRLTADGTAYEAVRY